MSQSTNLPILSRRQPVEHTLGRDVQRAVGSLGHDADGADLILEHALDRYNFRRVALVESQADQLSPRFRGNEQVSFEHGHQAASIKRSRSGTRAPRERVRRAGSGAAPLRTFED